MLWPSDGMALPATAKSKNLLKGLTCVPRVTVTDDLKSYGAAKRDLLLGVEHRQYRYFNIEEEADHSVSCSSRYRCSSAR